MINLKKKENHFFLLRNTVLKQIQLPSSFCAYRPNPSCAGLTQYRTNTGVCNNPRRPYQGSAQTAFGRLLPPAYEDGRYLFLIDCIFENFFFCFVQDYINLVHDLF